MVNLVEGVIPSIIQELIIHNIEWIWVDMFFDYKWTDRKFCLFNYNKIHLNHPETKAYWETHPN